MIQGNIPVVNLKPGVGETQNNLAQLIFTLENQFQLICFKMLDRCRSSPPHSQPYAAVYLDNVPYTDEVVAAAAVVVLLVVDSDDEDGKGYQTAAVRPTSILMVAKPPSLVRILPLPLQPRHCHP